METESYQNKNTTNIESLSQTPSNNLNTQNTPVLKDDVIVSETNQDPEKVYEKIKNLGEGPLGDVWLVRHKITGKQSAMKIIEKSPCYNEKEIKNEIEILKMMDHPYILKILEFHLTEDKFYILTDYCPEGDLFGEICIKTKFSGYFLLISSLRLGLKTILRKEKSSPNSSSAL